MLTPRVHLKQTVLLVLLDNTEPERSFRQHSHAQPDITEKQDQLSPLRLLQTKDTILVQLLRVRQLVLKELTIPFQVKALVFLVESDTIEMLKG